MAPMTSNIKNGRLELTKRQHLVASGDIAREAPVGPHVEPEGAGEIVASTKRFDHVASAIGLSTDPQQFYGCTAMPTAPSAAISAIISSVERMRQ
jgi:hypothetical protein